MLLCLSPIRCVVLYYIVLCCILAVGKSSLLTRFTENTFLENYAPTIGIDYSSRMIRVDRAICKLEIWDTAGTVSR
jgi:small GTP-binding protein